jgi:hypothetical protein
LALVLIERIYLIVVIPNISMARIVHIRHVDEDAYLKGNIEPDPDELDLVFERSPTYAKVLEQVRIELNWMDPSDIIELEGMHNAGFRMHFCWKIMRINSEQRWGAYKEVVVESLDKARESGNDQFQEPCDRSRCGKCNGNGHNARTCNQRKRTTRNDPSKSQPMSSQQSGPSHQDVPSQQRSSQ